MHNLLRKARIKNLPHPKEIYENFKNMYRVLMREQGYKLHELDSMDIHFFFELINEKKKVYIDEIW